MTVPLVESKSAKGLDLHALAGRLFLQWRKRPYTFWLDSASSPNGRLGRYSFVGTDPCVTLITREGLTAWRQMGTGYRWTGGPWGALARAVRRVSSVPAAPEIPFGGGLVGYLGYDFGVRSAGIHVPRRRAPFALPDMAFGLYDAVVALDHVEGRVFLVANGLPYYGAKAIDRARQRLRWLHAEVQQALRAPMDPIQAVRTPLQWRNRFPDTLQADFTRAGYIRAVDRVLAAIARGEVEQVNLSQRFVVPAQSDAASLYMRLRAASPAPFAGCLRVGDSWMLSSSPERFLRIRGDEIETRPIKGTRPRGQDAAADERNRTDLLYSVKDRVEHEMIVDLQMQELAKICEEGSVAVAERMACETYETVFHLVSTVTGRLLSSLDRVECVRTLFPGASISGRPKDAAMKLIAALEPVPRGVYTGAMGYFGIGGHVDLNVLIRTLVVSRGHAAFHVGGGIVAASDPEAEYEETLDKAEGMVRALFARKTP